MSVLVERMRRFSASLPSGAKTAHGLSPLMTLE